MAEWLLQANEEGTLQSSAIMETIARKKSKHINNQFTSTLSFANNATAMTAITQHTDKESAKTKIKNSPAKNQKTKPVFDSNSTAADTAKMLEREGWKNPRLANEITEEISKIDPDLGSSVQETIMSAFANTVKDSTLTTYISAVESLVTKLPPLAVAKILPARTPAQLIALFAPSISSNYCWSSMKLYMAAICHFHYINGFDFDNIRYAPEFVAFWKGAKRLANMENYAKEPVSTQQLQSFLNNLLYCGHQTNASKRNAAWAAFSFFGVRRVSEGANLLLEDVTIKEDGIQFKIRKMKNRSDTTTCFIPYFKSMNQFCPAKIIEDWIHLRQQHYGNNPKDHLFCTTRGVKAGEKCRPETLRMAVDKFFVSTSISTHSLRKGGACYWARNVGRNVCQTQGGWVTTETMDRIYLKISQDELATTLAESAANSTTTIEPPPIPKKTTAKPTTTKPKAKPRTTRTNSKQTTIQSKKQKETRKKNTTGGNKCKKRRKSKPHGTAQKTKK